MQRRNVPNPGWAAFDRKHREEETSGPVDKIDPFPPLSDSAAKSAININSMPPKSFSAAARPRLNAPSLETSTNADALKSLSSAESDRLSAVKLIKAAHSWADIILIEDVLSAVNGDKEQASALLTDMASSANTTEQDKNNCTQENTLEEKGSADGAHKVLVSTELVLVPAEPEWEEDDLYWSHRREAIKMMRSASHHSQAARNAFLRGEHLAAHQLSLKAQEEWGTAENLNSKAADEILRFRNCKNDLWTIDLHGLHASEAVLALKKYLETIEYEIMANPTASARAHTTSAMPIKDFRSGSNALKVLPQRRPTVLQVITGVGNHSRGREASILPAVRGFLIENGYRFDDVKPGVFAVHPKFRNKSAVDLPLT